MRQKTRFAGVSTKESDKVTAIAERHWLKRAGMQAEN